MKGVEKHKTISLLSYHFQLLIYDSHLTIRTHTHELTYTGYKQSLRAWNSIHYVQEGVLRGLIEAVSQKMHDLQITSSTLLVCT